VLGGELLADPLHLLPVGQVGGDAIGRALLGQDLDGVVDLGGSWPMMTALPPAATTSPAAWRPIPLLPPTTTSFCPANTGMAIGRSGPSPWLFMPSSQFITKALVAWDQGQVSDGPGILHGAARRGRAVSADARHVQPLLALTARLADLGRCDEAEKVTASIDRETLRGIPAQAALSVLDARLCLARGSLSQATAAAYEAVTAAGTASSSASLGPGLLALIALRQDDLATAARHLASLRAPVPPLVSAYARSVASMTQAKVAEAREGPAAAIRHIRTGLCRSPAPPRGVAR